MKLLSYYISIVKLFFLILRFFIRACGVKISIGLWRLCAKHSNRLGETGRTRAPPLTYPFYPLLHSSIV